MKRIVKRSLGGMGLIVLAFSISACVNAPSDVIPVVKGHEQNDIPVKEDFELVESESYEPGIPEATKFRSWKGIYRGPGHLQDIGPWYVGAMKHQGWKMTKHFKKSGPLVYHYWFVKNDEEARISIRREYTFELGKPVNFVTARVGPRGTEDFSVEDLETMKVSGLGAPESTLTGNGADAAAPVATTSAADRSSATTNSGATLTATGEAR